MTKPSLVPLRHGLLRNAAAILGCVFSLSAAPSGAEVGNERESLAGFFLQNCLRHIEDFSQLSSAVAQNGGRRVENPPPEAGDGESSTSEIETWLVPIRDFPTILHFKRGSRDGRRFALCFVRQQNLDVFEESVETVTRSLTLRRVRSTSEAFTKRASFLLDRNGPILVDVSAAQGPLVRFTMISATKLLGAGP
ncbi:hypothetical protein [Microvirga sp. Mcv34]|uniref:hypothetical protein n=1 Tax=Microvirga sp. Mcv34 TaxID=2926016 RepID=UPI0021C67A3F|nr:hypothetical protein [Microvirga sp. Mcv34]